MVLTSIRVGRERRIPGSPIIGASSTMRSNQRDPPAWAARSRTVAPMDWASAKNGGGQSGRTISLTKLSRSI